MEKMKKGGGGTWEFRGGEEKEGGREETEGGREEKEGGREGGRDAHDGLSGRREILSALHPRDVSDEAHGGLCPPVHHPIHLPHLLPAVREEGEG